MFDIYDIISLLPISIGTPAYICWILTARYLTRTDRSGPSRCGSVSHAWVGTQYMGGERGQPSQCSRLLVISAPGSRGEILPFSSSIELSGGNLRLEVTYNPGTGWLYDKNLKKVSSRGSSCLNT